MTLLAEISATINKPEIRDGADGETWMWRSPEDGRTISAPSAQACIGAAHKILADEDRMDASIGDVARRFFAELATGAERSST